MGTKSALTEEHTSAPLGQIRKPRSLMVPVVLITLGVTFLLGEYIPAWGIGKTWPVLLVVIGVVKLIEVFIPKRPRPSSESAKPSSRGGEST